MQLRVASRMLTATLLWMAWSVGLPFTFGAQASAGGESHTTKGGRSPKLEYHVRFDPTADPAFLNIALKGSYLPRSGSDLVCELRDWGEWRSASFGYLRNISLGGHPAVTATKGIVLIEPHLLVGGSLELQYELLVYPFGSVQHEQRQLLPFRADGHVFAFVANTLVGLTVDGAPLKAEVVVNIDAPDQVIFTGWAGRSNGSQIAPAPNPATANALFAVGQPRGQMFTKADSTPIEVMQFSDGADATPAVADVVARVLPSFTRATGRPPGSPVRIVIGGPSSSGGTATEAGLRIGVGETGRLSDSVKELIAHELFHLWLGGGGQLTDDGSLVWFREGFTDYCALWHCAATGVTSPGRFSERMLQIERKVRTRSALGRVAFADPGVNWRDGDGPNETLAYGGGALLAFVMDVRLREQNNQSVGDVIRKLLQLTPREYGLEHLREATKQLGLEELYEKSIVSSHLPEIRPMLQGIGFDEAPQRKVLTYLGIEAKYVGPANSPQPVPVVVTAVDPEGPAAGAGLRPGDRIFGFEPLRSDPPELTDQAPARYRFGLTLIASGAETAVLDVERDARVFCIELNPVLVHGGRRMILRWNPRRGSGFFKLPK